MTPAISVTGVGWSQAGSPVLREAHLTVAQSQIVGLLGQPGSGRSIMLAILHGLVKPDVGTAQILGHDCWNDAVALQRLVSSRPNLMLWPELTCAEALDFAHTLAGDSNRPRCRELLHRFHVDPDTPVGELDAKGRNVISLAALLCRPARVLLVDDAVAGLHDRDIDLLGETFAELVSNGATLLLTGRIDDATASLCDQLVIMDRGHCRPAFVARHSRATDADTLR